jgi:hypothetical protein
VQSVIDDVIEVGPGIQQAAGHGMQCQWILANELLPFLRLGEQCRVIQWNRNVAFDDFESPCQFQPQSLRPRGLQSRGETRIEQSQSLKLVWKQAGRSGRDFTAPADAEERDWQCGSVFVQGSPAQGTNVVDQSLSVSRMPALQTIQPRASPVREVHRKTGCCQ